MAYQFPKNFTWGVSTASHQIEGNTVNDWSEWEQQNAKRLAEEAPKAFGKTSPVWNEVKTDATNPANYISGVGDDSYNRIEEDIALLKELGVKAYRFSIEWSRIEPEKGKFDEVAIKHYVDFIGRLRQENIQPWVTTVHRTIPQWVAKQGGWANKDTVIDYGEYVKVLASHFQDHVQHWLPLNEPILNVGGGFFSGQIPPGRKNPIAGIKALRNMIQAHRLAHQIIHHIIPEAQVGVAHAAIYAEGHKNRWVNCLLVSLLHYVANWIFLDRVKNHLDFIGIQYYTRGVIGFGFARTFIPFVKTYPQSGPHSDMGQEIYSEGLYNFAKLVHRRYHKPIVVTENGVADRNDTHRANVIRSHIAQVARALQDGIDMRGYFHWSLLDNFEWDKGYWPRFGLVHVNRTTLQRTLRPSAEKYKEIIRQNR